MRTRSGRMFWPLEPRAEEADIRDVAQGLSCMCRFNGQCREFYSVAQHSVIVSRHLPEGMRLWGLLHDCSESFFPDMITPVKRAMPEFDAYEKALLRVMVGAFGLPPEEPAEVKRADRAVLAAEARDLFSTRLSLAAHPDIDPISETIRPWSPAEARERFLARYAELRGEETCAGYEPVAPQPAASGGRGGDGWMRTHSGRRIWPLDPDPAHVDIADIAHALSNVARYNGHTREFYSVAQHSVIVARHVPRHLRLWALLHNASKAYLPDIATPLRRAVPSYVAADARMQRAIAAAHGLGPEEPGAVTRANLAVGAAEARDLFDGPLALASGIEASPVAERIEPWSQAQARAAFMDHFRELAGRGGAAIPFPVTRCDQAQSPEPPLDGARAIAA